MQGPPARRSIWPPPGKPSSKRLGPVEELQQRPAYQGGIYLLTVQIISHQIGLLLSRLTGWRAEVTDHSIAYLSNHKQDLKEGRLLRAAHLWRI